MKNKIGYCVECGDYCEFTTKKVKEKFVVREIEVNVEITKAFCAACGEVVVCEEIEKENDIIVFDAYKKAVGLLTSKELIEIRKKRNITQKQMAEILGLGEKDITRFENGSIQSFSTDKLLRNIENDSWYFEYLISKNTKTNYKVINNKNFLIRKKITFAPLKGKDNSYGNKKSKIAYTLA